MKCHPKSYHDDIKYHITMNMIFSVVVVSVSPLESQLANVNSTLIINVDNEVKL